MTEFTVKFSRAKYCIVIAEVIAHEAGVMHLIRKDIGLNWGIARTNVKVCCRNLLIIPYV